VAISKCLGKRRLELWIQKYLGSLEGENAEKVENGGRELARARFLKHWRAILLLLIILSLGLLTGLKLSGMILTSRPLMTETISLGPVLWQVNFTAGEGVPFNRELNTTFEDDCLITFMTTLGKVSPGPDFLDYVMTAGVSFNVSSKNEAFRLTDARITFSITIGDSTVDVIQPQPRLERNLSPLDYALYGREAYIHLVPANGSAHSTFNDLIIWNLYSWNVNRLEVDFHVTYYNGTAYKTTIQPFILTLIGTY